MMEIETPPLFEEKQDSSQVLIECLKEAQTFPQKTVPVRSLWSSKIGHPCVRYLYHHQRDWPHAIQGDWKGIGELGNLIADYWIRKMSERGFRVFEEQVALRDDLVKTHKIGGRIDCRIGYKDYKPLVAEIKTLQPRDWESINSWEDIKNAKQFWIPQYYSQLQIYLLSLDENDGIFVLINKGTLETKILPVPLDMEYCEGLLKKAEQVNKALSEEKPPERIPFGKICQRCEFRMVCLPDISSEGLELIDNDNLDAILKERASLEESADRYAELDVEAKNIAKTVGKDFICNTDWKVEFRNQIRKSLDTKAIPEEIRKNYEKETQVSVIKFIPLGK